MFWNWFKPKVVVQYKVVEVKAPRIPAKWTKEIKDAVSTLPAHPGFIALMDRFELQKQMLEHKAGYEYHKDLREGDYIQAGIFWLGYAQRLVAESTKVPQNNQRDAYEEEMEAFRQLDSQIERIGMDSQGPQQ